MKSLQLLQNHVRSTNFVLEAAYGARAPGWISVGRVAWHVPLEVKRWLEEWGGGKGST